MKKFSNVGSDKNCNLQSVRTLPSRVKTLLWDVADNATIIIQMILKNYHM